MRTENFDLVTPLGPVRHITLHWTADRHNVTFDHYHFCITGRGQIVQTRSVQQLGSHTWYRNSNNLGIALCAKGKGSPVTGFQREGMARLIAELCGIFGLDIQGTIALPELYPSPGGVRLLPTGRLRSFPVVADHAIFAQADGYYPDRWDIGDEYEHILARAKILRAAIIAGQLPNSMVGRIT
jgi:hypothetical protein